MNVILDEVAWTKKVVEERTLGQKPSETLTHIARFYFSNGYKSKEIKRLLEQFILQCNPSASIPRWSNTLDFILTYAAKRPQLKIEYIPVTETEMKTIDGIDGRQAQRLAFTLLCLAKYWDLVNNTSSHWVNSKDNEIMRMANIKTSIKRQSILFRKLNELGLIQFSHKVDNTNVQVCFMSESHVVMQISDFRNLGYQYLKYHGGPYYQCKSCGVTVKSPDKTNRRNLKYCPDCTTRIGVKQRVDAVMRLREKRSVREDI